MKVKLGITLDIDVEKYWDRFIDPTDSESYMQRRDAVVRDDAKGLAAAAVVGWFNEVAPEVLRDYDVDVWPKVLDPS